METDLVAFSDQWALDFGAVLVFQKHVVPDESLKVSRQNILFTDEGNADEVCESDVSKALAPTSHQQPDRRF